MECRGIEARLFRIEGLWMDSLFRNILLIFLLILLIDIKYFINPLNRVIEATHILHALHWLIRAPKYSPKTRFIDHVIRVAWVLLVYFPDDTLPRMYHLELRFRLFCSVGGENVGGCGVEACEHVGRRPIHESRVLVRADRQRIQGILQGAEHG